MSGLVELGARDLAAAIRAGETSCRGVMVAYLAQIERLNRVANAIVSLREPEELLAEADAADAALWRGDPLGPLHGVPQAPKDLAPTRGIRTTHGSPLFADDVPAVDAFHVERLRSAGAILIGKTNTPEFGLGSQTTNPVFGATRNAWAPDRTAGGSSGGAAVALALRMLPVADGSDMGGSLRNPAGWNGVVGFRPSPGRVASGPAEEAFLGGLAVDGPMGRTVSDTALLLSVLAGPDRRDPRALDDDPAAFAGPLDAEHAGTRVAWIGDWGGHLPVEPGVLDVCREGLAALEAIGCVVEEAVPPYPPGAIWDAWVTLRHWLVGCGLAPLADVPEQAALMKPDALWEVEGSRALRAADVHAASVVRTAWHAALLDFLDRYDVIVAPTAQVFPFPVDLLWPTEIAGRRMDTYHRWMEVVVPWTMAGCPVCAVPAGLDPRGLPMGLQLVGRPRDDLAVLRLAHAYEAAHGYARLRPPLLDQPA